MSYRLRGYVVSRNTYPTNPLFIPRLNIAFIFGLLTDHACDIRKLSTGVMGLLIASIPAGATGDKSIIPGFPRPTTTTTTFSSYKNVREVGARLSVYKPIPVSVWKFLS